MSKSRHPESSALKKLGRRLMQRREELQLSQVDVAERARVRQEKVSRVERGFSEAGWIDLLRIMRALDVPCEEACELAASA